MSTGLDRRVIAEMLNHVFMAHMGGQWFNSIDNDQTNWYMKEMFVVTKEHHITHSLPHEWGSQKLTVLFPGLTLHFLGLAVPML